MLFSFPSYSGILGISRENISGFPAVLADKEINNESYKFFCGTKTTP